MKTYRIFIFLLILLAIPNLCFAQGGKEAFSGAWKLISFEMVGPNGQIREPYGKNPVGLIIYDPSGYMSVQFMPAENRPKLPAIPGNAPPADLLSAYLTYGAYFGTYEVNEKEGFVVHHVLGNLNQNNVGKDQKRTYKISGNRISLMTPPAMAPDDGLMYVSTLVWERMK